MALTTTMGNCLRRLATMLATRSMASALSTEVPPNFITIMRAPFWELVDSYHYQSETFAAHKRKTHQPLHSGCGSLSGFYRVQLSAQARR
jgi:hypothetical protein